MKSGKITVIGRDSATWNDLPEEIRLSESELVVVI